MRLKSWKCSTTQTLFAFTKPSGFFLHTIFFYHYEFILISFSFHIGCTPMFRLRDLFLCWTVQKQKYIVEFRRTFKHELVFATCRLVAKMYHESFDTFFLGLKCAEMIYTLEFLRSLKYQLFFATCRLVAKMYHESCDTFFGGWIVQKCMYIPKFLRSLKYQLVLAPCRLVAKMYHESFVVAKMYHESFHTVFWGWIVQKCMCIPEFLRILKYQLVLARCRQYARTSRKEL